MGAAEAKAAILASKTALGIEFGCTRTKNSSKSKSRRIIRI